MKQPSRRTPIELNIEGVTNNRTLEELYILVEVLEGVINRCCLSCDEPKQVIEMIKQNGALNNGRDTSRMSYK